MRRTDLALMPMCCATCRVLLLVPGWSSCEHISSCTLAMFSAESAIFGRPLPTFLSFADPDLSILRQMLLTVQSFHCFCSYADTIAFAPNPCSRNVGIRILSLYEILATVVTFQRDVSVPAAAAAEVVQGPR